MTAKWRKSAKKFVKQAFSLGVPLRLSAQMVEGPLFNPAGSRNLDALTYQAKGGSQRP